MPPYSQKSAAQILWTAVAVLDPGRPNGRIWGTALALIGLATARRLQSRQRWLTPATCLALMFALAAFTQPEDLRADASSHYAYLRSMAFDRDLDFANEWRYWGFGEMSVTPTGRRFNQHPVGPALPQLRAELQRPAVVGHHQVVQEMDVGQVVPLLDEDHLVHHVLWRCV